MNIEKAIKYMIKYSNLILPFSFMPGTYITGYNFKFDKKSWNKYSWNPLPWMKGVTDPEPFDLSASLKPTWIELTVAENNAIILDLRTNLLEQNDIQATNRIALLYHPKAAENRNREWEVRFSGIDLTTQDTKRVQLLAIHEVNKIAITAAVTLSALKSIDVETDIGWIISG